MDYLEKVEKLREKANVTYEEAKSVLDQADGNLLDAMILLEKQGKFEEEPAPKAKAKTHGNKQSYKANNEESGDAWAGFWRWIKGLVSKANRNNLQIRRHDSVIAAMPVTVFVIALVCAFYIALPLMIIGLFCGCSYSFVGPDLGKSDINKAWDKASEVAESIKEDIKKEMEVHEYKDEKQDETEE